MVVAWAQTNAELGSLGINRRDVGGAQDGAQSAPAIADNTGEFFAVAWLNGTGAETTVRAKFYDSLGNPDELLPGPIDLNDTAGTIVSGPVIAGWIEGYTVAWREQAADGEPLLYRARLVGPEAPIGQEFTLEAADPNGYAVLNQDKLSLAGWEQIIDPVAETVAVGFNALWVSTVDTGDAATLDRIMLQRFEVPLDAAGNPQPAVAAGIDGRAGLGSDAAIALGTGRDPSMAALHDGEQIIVWIDGNDRVQGRFLNPDGTDVPGVSFENFATVAAGHGVKVASFGVGSFGVFWVAAEGDGLVIKGQTWSLPDGAANWGPLGPVQTIATLPAGFEDFNVAGFGEGSEAGVVSYSVAVEGGTQVLAQAFDPLAVPFGAPFTIGTPGAEAASKPASGMAGLIGERAAVVWQDAADDGDVRVQIIDTRDPGVVLVGDRDRLDGRVDARRDVLVGTVGDDMIVTDRGDTRRGRSEDDQAFGAIGNDTLYGGGGDDLLDAGEERLGDAGPEAATDVDVAAYRGGRGAYSVTVNGDGSFTVKDMRQGIAATDGTDTIDGVEQLAFDSQIAGPALTVGPDRVDMGVFFQGLPPAAESDGTPAPWGLDNTAAFAVNSDPAGAADLTTGSQTAPSAVGLLGGFAFAWQSGDAVLVKAYDTLGQPDAAFGGGAAASVFTLTDGVGSVVDPVAAMAGETGVVAAWQEAEGAGASVIKGRFVSAITGIIGDGEFQVKAAPAGVAQRDAAVAGYEVVDAENDTAEYGFLVGYTEGAGSDGVGRILLDRMTLFVRSVDDFDVEVAGERAPASVGLDGFVGVGSGDDLAARELSAAGRDLSLDTLHDGEAVASWIEGDTVKVKILVPAFDPVNGITAFDASRPVIDAVTGIDAGSKQQIVGLGFNFAIAYMENGVFKAQLYTGSGGAWTRSDVVSFGEMPEGTIGDVRLVTTDLDGTAFTMFVEAIVDGTATVHGQHFDGAGHKVGQPFVAFQAPVLLAGNGAGGFSAAPLDEGRIVVAAEGQAVPGADGHGIVGALLDTRIPGQPIAGPREGAPEDVLVGTTGDDAIDGRVAEDELHGGLGNDVLTGGSENDTLFGEQGGDTLLGGSENDSLEGGEGDDLLLGGFGADILAGGAGSDTVSTQGEFARFQIDLAAGTVRSDRNPATGAVRPGEAFAVEDTFTGSENATGGEAADRIVGDAGNNVLQGRGGNDTLEGGGGTDTAVFRGARAEYTASFDAATGAVTVSHIGAGADGVDRLTNVEQFRFADDTVGLPALLAGNATTGVAVDGYIAGATVFWDADGDRTLDAGETSTTTESDGTFSLAGPGGGLVLRGGVDIATLLPPGFALEAPAGWRVISPLTTLVARIAGTNGGDVPAAREAVLTAFGLPASFDLMAVDPIEGMLGGNAQARAATLVGAQVVDTLALLQAAAEGAGLGGLDPFGALAARIVELAGGRLFLTRAADVAGVAETLGLGSVSGDLVQDTASVAAASNVSAASRVAAATDPRKALVQLAAVGIVAREDAAEALRGAALNPFALEGVVADFTAAALSGRVNGAAARVGDVDADGDLDGTGIALSGSSVAEDAAGAVVGTLTVAVSDGAVVNWEVLNGGVPDARFMVDAAGGTSLLRLKPGIALDHEAEAAVTITVRASLETEGAPASFTRDFVLEVLDRNDPAAVTGGTLAATLVEEQNVPAPPAPPILTAAGGFGFSDQDIGTPHGVTFALASVASSDPAVDADGLGTLAATLTENTATGTGDVAWSYQVDNELLQSLGAGDTLTETWRVSVGTNTEFAASGAPGTDRQGQKLVLLSGGGYVVVWTETRPGDDFPSVYARVFGGDGTPITGDFRVSANSPEFGAQTPSVAALASGGFVVVWRSDGDAGSLPAFENGFSFGITGQVFDANGAKLGGEFQANTAVVGNQVDPQVVALAGDRFLVTWTSEEERIGYVPETGTIETYFPSFLQGQAFKTGSDGAIRVVDPNSGEPAEFRISPMDAPAGEALLPSIEGNTTLALAEGGFVTVWSWSQGAGQFVGVFVQAYDNLGQPMGGPVTANMLGDEPSSAVQYTALRATALADGGFALAWQRGDGLPGVAIRVFDADGTARSGMLALGDAADLVMPSTISIAALAGGGFVVAWTGQDDNLVRGQAFSADGHPIGARFLAETGSPAGTQLDPRVAGTADGGFVLLWSEQAGLDVDVYAQEFTSGGVASAPGLQVNLQTPGAQDSAEVIALPGGGFVATWVSHTLAGDAVRGRVVEAGGPGSGTQLVTVTLQGVNDAPIAEALTLNPAPGAPMREAGFGQAGSATLFDDLSTAGIWADADAGEAQQLRVVRAAGQGAAQADLAFDQGTGEAMVQGTHGRLFVKTGGALRYVLDQGDADTEALTAGQIAQEVFAYTVANGGGAENEAASMVTMRIVGTNDAPTATADGATLLLPAPPGQVAGPLERSGTVADNVADADAGQTGLLHVARASAEGAPTAKLTFGAAGEAAVAGAYGTLFIRENGAWRYVLDQADPDTLALTAGARVTDTFAYTVLNGPVGPRGASLGNEATSNIAINIRLLDDPGVLPKASIAAASPSKAEGNTGSTAFTFTVSLDAAANTTQTVQWRSGGTNANPATAADMAGGAFPSGAVTFARGETGKTITVNVAGDTDLEPDEELFVYLAEPSSGLALGANYGTWTTILNDDTGVLPEDEAPVGGTPVDASLAEDVAVGTVVGTVSATDPEGADLTYALTTTGVPFEVDPDTGVITTTAALDHETAASYALAFSASDGTNSTVLSATVTVTDVDEAPVADPVPVEPLAVAENQEAGAVVGSVSAADPEGAGVSYSLAKSASGLPFAIDAATGEITTTAPLDREQRGSYTLEIEATDETDNTAPISIAVSVANVDEPPVEGDLVIASIAEDEPVGTVVGAVSAADPEGEPLTYALATQGVPFEMDPETGRVTTTARLDYEDAPSYVLDFTASDGANTTTVRGAFLVSVADVDEPPVFDPVEPLAVGENLEVGAEVGSVSAIDPDGAAVTYALATENVPFAVNAETGAITTTSPLDREATASYNLAVTATDASGNATSITVPVTVSDVNEPPVPGAAASFSVVENLDAGTVVGSVSAVDPEGGSVSYALLTDGLPFAVDFSTGRITTTAALDREQLAFYTLNIEATDETGRDTPITVAVSVSDVDEAPVNSTTGPFAAIEGQAAGSEVGTVSATDPEGAAITYTIASGNDDGAFAVDEATGVVSTTEAFGFGDETSRALGIAATDGINGLTIPIMVAIENVPDAPVFTAAQASVREDAATGTVLGRFSVGNAGDAAVVFAGPSGEGYEVAEDGTVTLTAPLDFETARSLAVSATAAFADASDPNARSPAGNGTVEVADLYEGDDPGQLQPTAPFTMAGGVALVQGTSADFRARDGGLAFASGDGAVTTVVPGVERAVFADGTLSFASDTQEAFLQRLYLGLLEREADGRGIAYHAERLESGATLGQIAQGFAESPEYIGNANGVPSDRAFVEALYVNFLGRQADTEGADFWTGHLASGAATRGDTAAGFALSAEAQGKYNAQTSRGVWVADWEDLELDALYIAGLGREADPGARAAGTAALEAGTLTRNDLAQAIVNSVEYELRHGPDAAGAVNVIFRDALGRDADQAARDFFTGAYNTHGAAPVLLAIAGSAEFAVIEGPRASADHLFT